MIAPLDSDLQAERSHTAWQTMASSYEEQARNRKRRAIAYVNWRRSLTRFEASVAWVTGRLGPRDAEAEREWARYKTSPDSWVSANMGWRVGSDD
jgi:hypothetical protein